MTIVAIGWAYVVLMMAITEDTPVAGIMTFLLYGALPVAIILYIGGAGGRRQRRRQDALRRQRQAADPLAAGDPIIADGKRGESGDSGASGIGAMVVGTAAQTNGKRVDETVGGKVDEIADGKLRQRADSAADGQAGESVNDYRAR